MSAVVEIGVSGKKALTATQAWQEGTKIAITAWKQSIADSGTENAAVMAMRELLPAWTTTRGMATWLCRAALSSC